MLGVVTKFAVGMFAILCRRNYDKCATMSVSQALDSCSGLLFMSIYIQSLV